MKKFVISVFFYIRSEIQIIRKLPKPDGNSIDLSIFHIYIFPL